MATFSKRLKVVKVLPNSYYSSVTAFKIVVSKLLSHEHAEKLFSKHVVKVWNSLPNIVNFSLMATFINSLNKKKISPVRD